MGKLLFVFVAVALPGCAFVPEQSSSIVDYCAGVRAEVVTYQAKRATGLTVVDLKAYIGFSFVGVYPERELTKMRDVADMVYEGLAPAQIEARCIAERTAGTWFK